MKKNESDTLNAEIKQIVDNEVERRVQEIEDNKKKDPFQKILDRYDR